MEVVDKLCRESQGEELHFIIAGAPSAKKEDYLSYIGDRKQVHLVFNDSYGILKNAACAIINSGTASLEAALIGTPQVVCWSSSALTVFVGRKILRIFDHIKYISLGNLIVDRLVFKEFIQEDFNVEMVTEEIGRLMSDDYRQEMLKGYAEIRSALGGQGASTAIAQAMLTELQK
jgi:lipid-A-disaccharide synthase